MDSLWFPFAPLDIFFNLKGPVPLNFNKTCFSVKKHFAVELPVNVETAANLCYSGALQAAITVIAASRAPLALLPFKSKNKSPAEQEES
jgi:hypothetical protein